MSLIRSYHIKHRRDLSDLLNKAKQIADYAVANKNNKTLLSTAKIKHIGLKSDIANQILRKYSRGNIRAVSNPNLVVPNTERRRTWTSLDGVTKTSLYQNIIYQNGLVTVKPLDLTFRWNPGKPFTRIHQLEIDQEKFMITVSFPEQPLKVARNVLGIDLNCGIGRSIVNCANLETGELLNLGKSGPNIRKRYSRKRRTGRIKGNKEKRIMKDLDHKISRKVVDYAEKCQLGIVMEDLTGIRNSRRRGEGSRNVNRVVNSWSFYRLTKFIEYKAKERGITFEKVAPNYTSKECSYCTVIGERSGDSFVCKNRNCKAYLKKRHADINAAFNIGKRSCLVSKRVKIKLRVKRDLVVPESPTEQVNGEGVADYAVGTGVI